jgi:SAM-dependent methyltransferase
LDATDAIAGSLDEEAAFADVEYAKHAGQLGLNQQYFRKYAAPRHDWDWRQYGARLLGEVRGCRVLDLGCGMGEESTYLALMGAEVTAIDISPVGVRLTQARAEANGVGDRVSAQCMRCDPTSFPDETFDVVHGFGILHHIGLGAGIREVKRLLKPGGRGLFFEHMGNSALIERFRPKEGHYTSGECPITWAEVQAVRPEFTLLVCHPFHILSRMRRFSGIFAADVVKRIDHVALRAAPALRHLASGIVIYVEK